MDAVGLQVVLQEKSEPSRIDEYTPWSRAQAGVPMVQDRSVGWP